MLTIPHPLSNVQMELLKVYSSSVPDEWVPDVFGAADQSVFTRNIRNDEGEVTVVYSRVSGASGVTGSGPMLNLEFQAVGAGTAEVRVADAGLRDTQMQPVTAAMPPLSVKVE